MTHSPFAGHGSARIQIAEIGRPPLASFPGEDRWQAVRLAQLLRDMRPLLERAFLREGCFRIELRLGLAPIWCDPVGLEGAILTLVVHARRALTSGGSLRLAAAPFVEPSSEPGVCLQVSVANPNDRLACAAQLDRPKALDRIGLTVANLFANSVRGWVSLDRPTPHSLNISLWLPGLPAPGAPPPNPSN